MNVTVTAVTIAAVATTIHTARKTFLVNISDPYRGETLRLKPSLFKNPKRA
jgi:hypothetical protein